ncbi:hypothetical protein [Novosphingobium sp. SG720]|uniref:hypothetical protein n=1 Tax=Novosphingobium sp. SG720 TaxID=2586998 RepID=UPI001444D6E6|nr:hypothetical protein [Novosphingobium sp. SG720]NKJ41019.1 hypothetical protein [Novosphingobium sp. SG720]
MKINRAARQGRISPPRNSLIVAVLAALATACAPQAVIPPAPVRQAPPPPPQPAPPPVASAPLDWRDQPQTPGTWRYAARQAQFGMAGAGPVFAMECRQGQVALTIAGSATQPVPAAITTTSQQRALSAAPAGPAALVITLPARDNLLDAMAFSRGRFMVEVNGLPTLILPAWAEVGRVVEDCR